MYPIVDKQVLAPTITRFVVEAPLVADRRKPGNFVIVRVNETGERIPLTIVDSDRGEGTITIIVQAIGKTTMLLSNGKVGDNLADVVGPLGNPTPIEFCGTAICIGGGVGTAEVYPIAEALQQAGNQVFAIIGGRTKDLVILESEMREFCREVFVTTDDGTYGKKGLVIDQLQELIDRGLWAGAVYAIGPVPMMKAVAEMTRDYGIKTYVSLNPIMLDGTGMCGACRVTVNGKMKFACVDGPEFDAHEVDFEELMARNRAYVDLEQLSKRIYEESSEISNNGFPSPSP